MIGNIIGASGQSSQYDENIYNIGSGLRRGAGLYQHSSSTSDMPIIGNNHIPGSPERGSPSGLGEDGRTSVKLHAPPGGKSSLNLGGYGGSINDDDGIGTSKKVSKLRTGGRAQAGNLSSLR
jgi:hypothetical protein